MSEFDDEMNKFDAEMNVQVTSVKAENTLTGFKFLGHGWYHDPSHPEDTLLVLEGDSPDTHQFYFYRNRDPRDIFAKSSDPDLVKAAALPTYY